MLSPPILSAPALASRFLFLDMVVIRPSKTVCVHLVHVEGHVLAVALLQLLVLAHKENLRKPRQQRSRNRECSRRAKRNDVFWLVRLGP